jgi:hypothetical protein
MQIIYEISTVLRFENNNNNNNKWPGHFSNIFLFEAPWKNWTKINELSLAHALLLTTTRHSSSPLLSPNLVLGDN